MIETKSCLEWHKKRGKSVLYDKNLLSEYLKNAADMDKVEITSNKEHCMADK